MRIIGGIALALLLGACAGRVVPPATVPAVETGAASGSTAVSPARARTRPDEPVNVRQADGRIVAATPLPASEPEARRMRVWTGSSVGRAHD